jgi:glycosyltransferase involved in cell wall biosynthesis
LRGFCVLLLGRLVHIKGVDVALQAAASGGMTLLIAGDGPLRASLQRRAQQLGAAVRFLGVVTGADKHALLQAADAFALPSRQLASGRTEGLPCALLEAIGAGLPVVATRLPGIAPLLEQHAPRYALVPGEDPAALRAALLSLREPAGARAARERSRLALIASHGWARVGEHLAALLAAEVERGSGCGRALETVRFANSARARELREVTPIDRRNAVSNDRHECM